LTVKQQEVMKSGSIPKHISIPLFQIILETCRKGHCEPFWRRQASHPMNFWQN